MRPTTFGSLAVATALMTVLTGCPKDEDAGPMTRAEALEVLDESAAETQAAALTTSAVEVSTGFTIGKAASEAARELRAFIEAQLPCADVVLADAKLTVTYGAKPGSCTYRGHTFTGQHVITVSKDDGDVVVEHEWRDLSNGKVKVSGTAHVTWSLADETRHVKHELTWTRLSDGRTGTGSGDRIQRPLAGGLAEGFQVDGSRAWSGARGKWDLAIEGVEMRWADPVPQAGTYRLASPKGRSLELSFRRVDEDTIAVILKNDTKEFTFNVNAIGAVADGS